MQVKFLETPLGEMRAGADNSALYFLHFADTVNKYAETMLRPASHADAANGENAVLSLLEAELQAYFAGGSAAFSVKLHIKAHKPFRQAAWAALRTIPPAETRSYSEQAALMGLPGNFVRAVAAANAGNPFPLVLPCHRVIAANGSLSGYHGGIWRKQALLAHEKRYFAA
ncbi:MAG: methylated-DNA--[protein]-cysteine S-methyltransferase [Candidatus Tokpelaia sp.]|nr:MAG: methylated-DNA--[protein]-cysteine S-methyltransferase [Candidatus Tokpelaia sp.]KAA6204911.1 MAG: methylated-DNA--[protein]-cysteine S-methyltransferase [Candidatus Tokpelaia sp.]